MYTTTMRPASAYDRKRLAINFGVFRTVLRAVTASKKKKVYIYLYIRRDLLDFNEKHLQRARVFHSHLFLL